MYYVLLEAQTPQQRPSSPQLASPPYTVAECSHMASLHHLAPAAIPFFPSSTRATGPRRPPSLIRCDGDATTRKSAPPYWATAEAEIDAHLAASIPTSVPPAVRDPLLSLVAASKTPPRTMAPVLCVAACELMGGPRDRALGAASALRLLHLASHAKRPFLGLSSVSPAAAAFGDGVMLQTVDGLLTLSFQLVAETTVDAAGGAEPGQVLRVIVEMADAAGPRGIVEGLYEEIIGGRDASAAAAAEEEWLERVCRKKEGGLYACAAACGAILAGAGEEETERLRRCGTYVGMLHGLLQYYGSGQEEVIVAGDQLKSMAMSELEGFEGEKKDAIVGLLDVRP